MGYNLKRYGKRCLVTGASSGIGLEFARAVAAEGFDMVLVARRRERLETLAAELKASYGTASLVIEQDLSLTDSTEQVSRKLGGLEVDLLVLNAGFGYSGRFVEMSEQELADMIALNCSSVALLARRLLPPMLERGRGALIIVSSVLGFFSGPWLSAYTATKAFDLVLGESLRPELKAGGVDLLNLCPASTRTEFHAVANHHASGSSGSSLGRQADPARVVRLALKALGKKSTVYPFEGRAASLVTRLLPRGTVAVLAGKVFGRRMKP